MKSFGSSIEKMANSDQLYHSSIIIFKIYNNLNSTYA